MALFVESPPTPALMVEKVRSGNRSISLRRKTAWYTASPTMAGLRVRPCVTLSPKATCRMFRSFQVASSLVSARRSSANVSFM